MILLSMLPLLLIGLLGGILGYFYWDAALQGTRSLLESSTLLASFGQGLGCGRRIAVLAPLTVVLVVTPVLVMMALLLVALLMTPALVALVAERRVSLHLERKQGGSFPGQRWVVGGLHPVGAGGTGRVCSAVAGATSGAGASAVDLGLAGLPCHGVRCIGRACQQGRAVEIMQRHRTRLLGIGVVTAGAALSSVWRPGSAFVAAFFILVPLAIWIYTLVFAFSSLWFAHYCLAALDRLRSDGNPVGPCRRQRSRC